MRKICIQLNCKSRLKYRIINYYCISECFMASFQHFRCVKVHSRTEFCAEIKIHIAHNNIVFEWTTIINYLTSCCVKLFDKNDFNWSCTAHSPCPQNRTHTLALSFTISLSCIALRAKLSMNKLQIKNERANKWTNELNANVKPKNMVHKCRVDSLTFLDIQPRIIELAY